MGGLPPSLSLTALSRRLRVSHLFLGTQLDNVRDCEAKGRRGVRPSVDRCPKGHEYTAENIKKASDGRKQLPHLPSRYQQQGARRARSVTLPAIPSRFIYNSIAVVALAVAGVVFKHKYDGKVAAAALLQERIKGDSVVIRAANTRIAEANTLVLVAQSRADSLRKRSVADSARVGVTRAAYDSLRAHLDTTSVVALSGALDSADATIAGQDAVIKDLREQVAADDVVIGAHIHLEVQLGDKIRGLEQINRDIAKAVAPTHHIRDGAIGGAIVGGIIFWASHR